MKKSYKAPEFEYIDLLAPAMMAADYGEGETNPKSPGDVDPGWTPEWPED